MSYQLMQHIEGPSLLVLLVGLTWPVPAEAQLHELPSAVGPSQVARPYDVTFGGSNTLTYDSRPDNVVGNLDYLPALRPEHWTWQVLPDGLIYRSYLAGAKEPRFASAWVYEQDLGWIWDVALGGRVGILRYGTEDDDRPHGWQIDLEGAAFPRLDLEHDRDLVSADFRAGVPITFGRDRFQTKFAYYHLSSHLGDEFMVRNRSLSRINYVRDALVWGVSFYCVDDLRIYTEAAWSFYTDGGAEPWEFQFGVDYTPAGPSGIRGTPFFAINGHLREESDFGGNLVVQTGWQWRGDSGHLFRMGVQYFAGKSDQFEFFDQYEEKLGLAIWYDH